MKYDRELYFDGGHTATVPGTNQVERVMRFTNGSGDEVLDAVRHALGYESSIDDEEISEFSDPLEILIAQETE